MKKTCAFTGHRPQSLPFHNDENDARCKRLKSLLRTVIEKQIYDGVTHFISGMALGTDTFAAEIVLELKKQYPNITLEVALPCETQARYWNEEDRDRYYSIIEQCDKETLLQKHYTTDCLFRRNRYMVDNADVLIAVWNGRPSGTGKTVACAKEQGKEVYIIDPKIL